MDRQIVAADAGLTRAGDAGPLVRAREGPPAEIFARMSAPTAYAISYGIATGVACLILELADSRSWVRFAAYLFVGMATQATLHAGDWRRWWRFKRTPRVARLAEAAPGAKVRIVGTIEAEPGAPPFTAASGRPAVHVRTRFFAANEEGTRTSTAREEVRGVPFRIRLADGTSVRVVPMLMVLMDEHRRLRQVAPEALEVRGAAVRRRFGRKGAPRFDEAALSPGDEIEAVGEVTTEVSPLGEAGPGRGVPILHTLTPPQLENRLWVRTKRRRR